MTAKHALRLDSEKFFSVSPPNLGGDGGGIS